MRTVVSRYNMSNVACLQSALVTRNVAGEFSVTVQRFNSDTFHVYREYRFVCPAWPRCIKLPLANWRSAIKTFPVDKWLQETQPNVCLADNVTFFSFYYFITVVEIYPNFFENIGHCQTKMGTFYPNSSVNQQYSLNKYSIIQ